MTKNDSNALAQQTATIILDGFYNYFEEFHRITIGARQRFVSGDWKACQQASKDRLNMYLDKVLAVKASLLALADERLLQPEFWPEVKQEYSELVCTLSNFEIAETFFNSIYCKFYDHAHISNDNIFVFPSEDQFSRTIGRDINSFNYYHSEGNLRKLLQQMLDDVDLGLPYENKERDIESMRNVILRELPTDIIRNNDAFAIIHKAVFYRSKAAYLIGKVISQELSVPFVLPILQSENRKLYVDTLIFDPEQLSIIFSFTRAYFKVDTPNPSEVVRFLKDLMPMKSYSELYNSIGFNRHGKTEFNREFIDHLRNSDDKFVIAPGIKGMVMSVFTLPSYERVFKIIKDRFTPPKEMTRQVVKDKYMLVSRHDRAGRMADTQEFSNALFPKNRFSQELIDELLKVAPSSVEILGDKVRIKHLYVERRMTPLNLYLESASEQETRRAIDGYGTAIKQLAAANIFPGDMLYKNFGVTRHNRVVFYDYDEICTLTECNFRSLPEPKTPEQEMAAEPWYSVAPNDIFPEEFRTFLLGNPKVRKIFDENHRELFDPDYWKGLQKELMAGKVMDVLPYDEELRFKRHQD